VDNCRLFNAAAERRQWTMCDGYVYFRRDAYHV